MIHNYSGLPDVIDAFHEALSCHGNPEHHAWSHPLVYKAACLTGFSTLRLSQPSDSLAQFQQHYLALKDSLLRSIEHPAQDPLLQIDKLSKKLELDPALLYYLTKPKGSYMRNYMRQKCVSQLSAMNRQVDLPL